MPTPNLVAFESRIPTDDFCYKSFQKPESCQVCWLTALFGLDEAHSLYSEGGYWSQSGFWGRIPTWADNSEPADRKENARILLDILRRNHTDEEYKRINSVLSDLQLQGVNGFASQLGLLITHLELTPTSLLFAADAISRAIILTKAGLNPVEINAILEHLEVI